MGHDASAGPKVAAAKGESNRTSTVDEAKAEANQAAISLLTGSSCYDNDPEYDVEVVPLLPEVPAEPLGEAKYEFACRYKEIGNQLFHQGKLARAIRTYLVGMQMLQRICYEDPRDVFYDLMATPICVACFSNAALCALKLENYDLCCRLCDGGLRFSPQGTELAKLLLRKAQATLDRPKHSDPEVAVELLRRAAQAANSRQVVELLRRATEAAKEKRRTAERALFGSGKGFGTMRLASGAAARTDAKHECDELLRRGSAAMFGTGAEREFISPDMAEALGMPPATKDPLAAASSFSAAETRALEAGLQDIAAVAVFWRAAAASEMSEYERAADLFADYFKREAAGLVKIEPPLGNAYGRFHCGMALYRLHRVEDAISQVHLIVSERFTKKASR